MTRASKLRVKLLAFVALAAAAGLLAMSLRYVPKSQTTIAMVHTRDVFDQLRRSYKASQATGQSAVNSDEFVKLASTWRIDWNACSLRYGAVYDSWGNEVKIMIENNQIHLRSAGPDSTFFSPDDISRAFPSEIGTTKP